MDSENKFWLSFWFIMVFGFVSVVYVSVGYWKDYNTKMVQMIVDEGVTPIEATCAMQDDFGDNPTCVILALENKDK